MPAWQLLTWQPWRCTEQVRDGAFASAFAVHSSCCATRVTDLGVQYPTCQSASFPAGTSLGDPIEVGAALAVFGSSRASSNVRRQVLELSAAKSSLGHAEPAAGAAGMLRAIFRCDAHGALPMTACWACRSCLPV